MNNPVIFYFLLAATHLFSIVFVTMTARAETRSRGNGNLTIGAATLAVIACCFVWTFWSVL